MTTMLICANCGKSIAECCDIYYEAHDTVTGQDVVLCGECAELVARQDADISDESYCETLEQFKEKWLKKRTLTKREAAKVDRIKLPYDYCDEDEDE